MTDTVSKRKRSEIMSKIRGRNTTPELMVRKALRKIGHRYRLQYGKHRIDIAFPTERVAVFVDGCFWHRCPEHCKMPKSNVAFWKRKINGNAKRDKRETSALKKEGWKVVRIWEHDIRKRPWKALNRIRKSLE